MKKLLTLLFALLLSVNSAFASYFPSTQITDNKEAVYCGSTGVFTTTTSATDIFNFKGSSTKTIYIRRITWKQTNSAAGGTHHVYILKRSTANSGGTSVALTAVPLDSSFPSATASGVHYTANPTVGTSLGVIQHNMFLVGSIVYTYDFFDSTKGGSPIVLRGTSESISVNYNGVTDGIGTSACVDIEWSEK